MWPQTWDLTCVSVTTSLGIMSELYQTTKTLCLKGYHAVWNDLDN